MIDNDDNEWLKNHIQQSLNKQASQIKPVVLSRLEALRHEAGQANQVIRAAPDKKYETKCLRQEALSGTQTHLNPRQASRYPDRQPEASAFFWMRKVALIVLFMASMYWLQGGTGTMTIPTDDVLISNEEIEFLENLEMYQWLASEYG